MKVCEKCGDEIGGRDGVDNLCDKCETAAANGKRRAKATAALAAKPKNQGGKMYTMAISRSTGGEWVVKTDDPRVADLFGTDTLPTGFTPRATAEMVLAEIARLNPDRIVRLEA